MIFSNKKEARLPLFLLLKLSFAIKFAEVRA